MRALLRSSFKKSHLIGSSTSRRYSARILQASPSAVSTVSDLISVRPPENDEGLQVQVDGWVRNVRKSSAVRFVDITDGSCSTPLQAVVRKDLAQDLHFGTAVSLKGSWKNRDVPQPKAASTPSAVEVGQVASASTETSLSQSSKNQSSEATKPPELQVDEVRVLGHSDATTYPIQRKYARPDSLRLNPHLRMRTPLNTVMLRLRSDAMAALTQFFSEQKFQQTHPPIITESDCEGAGETFRVEAGTPMDPYSLSEQYLTVSSQLHLEAFAQALGNVWALSPTFRAERSDTSRHLSEFYMLEAEMSFVENMEEVMDFIQNMLGSVVQRLSQGDAWKDLDNFRLHPRDPEERQTMSDLDERESLERRWNGMLSVDKWPRITYTQAIEMLNEKGSKFTFPPTWGKGLQSEHEKYLAETIGFDRERNAYVPVFVTHYPQAIKAFYMRQAQESPAQGPVFDCFDLIVPDVGELAGGSMREHRLEALNKNMDRFFNTIEQEASVDWYRDLRRWGSPPHGGFGIGFDRLLSYLTGVKSVRDIVPFPRLYRHAEC